MLFARVAIDLGKQSFHLHGVSKNGIVLSREVCRSKLFAVVSDLALTCVTVKACPSAHHWERIFQGASRTGPSHSSALREAVRVWGQERRS